MTTKPRKGAGHRCRRLQFNGFLCCLCQPARCRPAWRVFRGGTRLWLHLRPFPAAGAALFMDADRPCHDEFAVWFAALLDRDLGGLWP